MKLYIVLAALTLLLTGVISAQVHSVQQPKIEAMPGRYQIVINANVRADTFLLDTQTERTWRRTSITDIDGHPDIWISEDRTDTDEQFIQWSERKLAYQNSLKDAKTKNPLQ